MVGDVRELPAHDLVALEFAARALQEPINRLDGFGAVELNDKEFDHGRAI